MRKGFRPTLEPPVSRRVNLDGRRPLFCVAMTTAVILLVAAIFAVSAWSLEQHRFGHNQFHFHAGDQVSMDAVSIDLTPVFCKGYQVTVQGQDTASLLPHRAQVNQSLMDTSSFALHHVPSRSYTFLEIYLLPGSLLEVGACRENGSVSQNIHILVIQGSSNFNKWSMDTRCESCVLRRVTILPTQICPGKTAQRTNDVLPEQEVSLNMTFTHTDRYMLVVHYARGQLTKGDNNENINPNNKKAGVIVSGIFNRTRYDTSNAEKICKGRGGREEGNNIDTCDDFDLDWGTNPDVVVEFANPRGRVGEIGQGRTVTTNCRTRYSFWLLVFLGGPVFVGFPVAGVFAWFLCRRSSQPSLKRLSRQADRRVRTHEEDDGVVVAVRDDKVLVRNQVAQQDEEDGCMTIQDD